MTSQNEIPDQIIEEPLRTALLKSQIILHPVKDVPSWLKESKAM